MLPIPEYFRRDVYPRLPALIKKFGPTFHYYNKPGIVRIAKAMKVAFAQYLIASILPLRLALSRISWIF